MSLIGVHAGFAGSVTEILLARTGVRRPVRWGLVFLSAVWAMLPDLHHVLPSIRPWYKPVVHDTAVANVFWFHGVFDRLDPRDRPVYSRGMMSAFFLVFSVTEAWTFLRARRRR
ncbi:hypothetical protein [Halopelagius fulvigenes]|uniref:Uncharacterized protein n=1 Tax=Halopelagius fulvigenes TaxID=1198324 RepID=A0ABD5TZZ3_9EURY